MLFGIGGEVHLAFQASYRGLLMPTRLNTECLSHYNCVGQKDTILAEAIPGQPAHTDALSESSGEEEDCPTPDHKRAIILSY